MGAVTVLPFTYMPFFALLSGENDVPDSNIIIFDSSGAANLFTGLLLFTLCETVDFKNGINDVFLSNSNEIPIASASLFISSADIDEKTSS